MKAVRLWLHARADNVAVGLLTAMFLSFILQIFSRYVINHPLGWTLEACLLAWLWTVFWGSAFLLEDKDHVKFDILYSSVAPRVRRVFALLAAVAIVVALGVSLPATADFIAFMKIEKTSLLGIRFDYVFSIYLVFLTAVILRYTLRAWAVLRGNTLNEKDNDGPKNDGPENTIETGDRE
ncbi:TRAP transporter small permease [Denitrobaculum tricleocarpae]|uniref:TRAP transporter small permease protein n=1 Tax=Denitrobaculum tricleocarpae TaxID=2591009 RepID=A0A545U1R3_9PROT|nr:TRAP transporter small permease subunit [Denitrobaculum tricleocarpae]TQV83343.1 TRAP transporter small permease subunit [Denitrobaculum tricleocarpae]